MHPQGRLTLICRKPFGKVFSQLGVVDQVLEVEKNNSQSYHRVVQTLKSQTVDHIVCPHKSFRSAKLAAQIKVSGKKIAFKKWWNFWAFSHTLAYPQQLPDALRQLSLLTLLSDDFRLQFEVAVSNKSLWNSTENRQPEDFRAVNIPVWAEMQLPQIDGGSKKNTVVVAPGSVWETKKWTQEGYTEVCRHFVEAGINVVLMGSQAEHELCESIRTMVPGAVNMSGQTSIDQSLQLLKRSKLLICNDSGAMHLASAAGTPTVAIYGPTTLDIGYRPWNQQSIVVQANLNCRPCGLHGHNKCPIGTHDCMKKITPTEVIQSANSLLKD